MILSFYNGIITDFYRIIYTMKGMATLITMKHSENDSLLHKKKLIAGNILPAIISFLILVVFDQLTKYLIDHNMDLYDSIPVIDDIFEIHYIRNTGAAWGILADQQIVFYICTILVCVIGCLFYIRCAKTGKYRDIQIVLILILSGAIGNFIDRLHFQYVIDFLYFKLIDFPVFNVADCYVTIGFFFMVILLFFKYKEEDLEKLMSLKK